MLKYKPWLDSVVRIPNIKIERHTNCVRLDKSERITRFGEEFFHNFMQSLTQEDFIAYPETMPLLERLCSYHKVSEENIFLVPGTDAAIKAFFEMSVSPQDKVIITQPCFPMYSVYVKLFNAKAIEIPYLSQTQLNFDLLLDSINNDVTLVTLANPNSPIGDYIETKRIEELVKKSNNYNIPVLLDEAYFEYSDGTAISLIKKYENIGVTRTFSKALGGAGIRLGYVLGSKYLIERLSKWRLMYEVNQIGVKFAVYLLNHIDEARKYAEETKRDRDLLVHLLKDAGYEVIPSCANWIHLHAGEHNSKMIDVLNKYNVLFKRDSRIPFSNGKDWIRLTVGPGLSQTPYMTTIISGNL